MDVSTPMVDINASVRQALKFHHRTSVFVSQVKPHSQAIFRHIAQFPRGPCQAVWVDHVSKIRVTGLAISSR